jgi:PAS domain S-box-containing protein
MEQPAYGTVFENVANALLIHCPNSGKVLDVNERFCELSGYGKEALVGELVDQFVRGQELYDEGIRDEALDTLRNGESIQTEWTLKTRDGRHLPIEVKVTLVELAGSERALSSVRDISERRESQRQRRRFQRAIEAAGHAVYITDTDGHIEYVNPAFERITGYSASEVSGLQPDILDSGTHDESYSEDLWNTIEAGDVWKEEITNQTKSGDHYHARQTIAPLTDETGAVDGFVAIQTDITEQEHQAERFGTLLENAMAVISLVDADGRIQFASPSVERFLGEDPEAMAGERLTEYVHPEDHDSVDEWLTRVREDPDEPVRNEARLRHANGSWRVFESVANNQLDNPAVEGIVINSRDVTERRDRERQLRVLDRLLRHNLRNDMTVVTGLAEEIAAEGAPELQTAAEGIIDTVGGLMATAEKERTIVDIISKRVTPEQFDIVPRIREGISAGAGTDNATVTTDLPERAEVVALPEIERVIAELVENAIVHTTDHPATVTVSATVESDWVDIRIEDRAPPIPDEEIDVLTATRIDALNHGSGIGLWLVNWVISRSDGQLFFERREHGNGVTVRVPRPSQ